MLVPLLVIYRVIWHTCTIVYKSLEVLRLCILGGGGISMMAIGGCEYWSVRGGGLGGRTCHYCWYVNTKRVLQITSQFTI